jgi:hypothetical protein
LIGGTFLLVLATGARVWSAISFFGGAALFVFVFGIALIKTHVRDSGYAVVVPERRSDRRTVSRQTSSNLRVALVTFVLTSAVAVVIAVLEAQWGE